MLFANEAKFRANPEFVIAIDFDDVLFHFSRRYQDLMRDMGYTPDRDYFASFGDIYDLPQDVKDYVNSRSKEFYIKEYLDPDAVEFMQEISKIGTALIVSSTFRLYADYKLELIDSVFGEDQRKATIITRRKDLILADILLDDSTHNLSAFQSRGYGVSILFDIGRVGVDRSAYSASTKTLMGALPIIRSLSSYFNTGGC